MSRQTAYIIILTFIITALTILLASRPQLIDSLLMHRFVPSTARAYLRDARQARQFTPYQPSPATFRTAALNMAPSNVEGNANHVSDSTIGPEDPAKGNNGQPLPLPPPPTAEEGRKLDMSSGEASVKMDHLGPLVVNKDGTLSRIGNWEQMTELEKKNTLRILGKRNQLRTEALRAGEGDQETGKS